MWFHLRTHALRPVRELPPSQSGAKPTTTPIYLAIPLNPSHMIQFQCSAARFSGAKAATVTTSMSATTQQFDTHAASGTGDFWKFAVQPLASGARYNLLTVNPGC